MIGKHILYIFSHVNGSLEFSHTSGSEQPHQDLLIAHIFIFLVAYRQILRSENPQMTCYRQSAHANIFICVSIKSL